MPKHEETVVSDLREELRELHSNLEDEESQLQAWQQWEDDRECDECHEKDRQLGEMREACQKPAEVLQEQEAEDEEQAQGGAEPRQEAPPEAILAQELPERSPPDNDLRDTVKALTHAVTLLATREAGAAGSSTDSHGKLLEALTEASREGNAMRAKPDRLRLKAENAEGLRGELERLIQHFNENRIEDRRT